MKFHTVIIPLEATPSGVTANPHLAKLVDEFNETRKSKARIYQSYVKDDGKKYVLVTTSKDLHLGFGQLTRDGQAHLARFLDHEFARGNFGQLMLGIEKDEGDESSFTLVAMSKFHDETCFGFSPAR